MARVLVTEEIADVGLDYLRQIGHEVVVKKGLSPEELIEEIASAQALIVRSGTQVNAAVIEAGKELVIIGRAGVGLDNVDVETASKNGVIVANAPLSNSLSAAEHTMGMLLAQARHIARAHMSLTSKEWKRSKFKGVELYGKTLGVIGLGRIGGLVAERASAFGMKIVAYDPYVSIERATSLGAELMGLESLISESDFVTLHLARTPETLGLINAALLTKAKEGQRIVNVARGGLIDEDALAEAIINGTIAGAALDVFAEEPITESPLFELEQVTVTPHLGASTQEAQHKAGVTIAEQVALGLRGDFVTFAVNLGAPDTADEVKPYVPLAFTLGEMIGQLLDELPERIEVEFNGEIAESENRLCALAVLNSVLGCHLDEAVSLVNAGELAKRHGVELVTSSTPPGRPNSIIVRSGGHEVGGSVQGEPGVARLVRLGGHDLDERPRPEMIVISNNDVPGVIGQVGHIIGAAGINISSMTVGESPTGNALMVIGVDGSADNIANATTELARIPELRWAKHISLNLPD